jgi:Arc/MetJ-type ribon-helix-helix transcriptional regulator
MHGEGACTFPWVDGHGMANGMATKKVTITLQEGDVEKIRDLVVQGRVASLSAFVQHAVGVSLADVAGWGVLLGEALRQTGGSLTKKERVWADDVLGVPVRKRGARRSAA